MYYQFVIMNSNLKFNCAVLGRNRKFFAAQSQFRRSQKQPAVSDQIHLCFLLNIAGISSDARTDTYQEQLFRRRNQTRGRSMWCYSGRSRSILLTKLDLSLHSVQILMKCAENCLYDPEHHSPIECSFLHPSIHYDLYPQNFCFGITIQTFLQLSNLNDTSNCFHQ